MKLYKKIIEYLYKKIKKRQFYVGDIVEIKNNEIVLKEIDIMIEMGDFYIVTGSEPLRIELFSTQEKRDEENRKNPMSDAELNRWLKWYGCSTDNLTKGY